jgi:hypothetical protein
MPIAKIENKVMVHDQIVEQALYHGTISSATPTDDSESDIPFHRPRSSSISNGQNGLCVDRSEVDGLVDRVVYFADEHAVGRTVRLWARRGVRGRGKKEAWGTMGKGTAREKSLGEGIPSMEDVHEMTQQDSGGETSTGGGAKRSEGEGQERGGKGGKGIEVKSGLRRTSYHL